jgi:hypothetical protein
LGNYDPLDVRQIESARHLLATSKQKFVFLPLSTSPSQLARALSGHQGRRTAHLALYLGDLAGTPGNFQIEEILKVHPELGVRVAVSRQAQRSLGRDSAPLGYYFCDPKLLVLACFRALSLRAQTVPKETDGSSDANRKARAQEAPAKTSEPSSGLGNFALDWERILR